ncbi:hypothetical protein [Pseudoroseicyclus sp. CXY001]|uniref:hypothetical protein n=1 Tax=Pseudoroseicyclus sp. CXY001 TaxID=3242492 RepID=UPI0035710EB3
MRHCLRSRALYPAPGDWLGRLAPALEGRALRLGLAIRPLEDWWPSALAVLATRGAPMPDRQALMEIAIAPRGWREVVTEIAAAFPGAPLTIWSEAFAARPAAAAALLGVAEDPDAPAEPAPVHNARPEGAALFTEDEAGALAEQTETDLAWLRAGAGGLGRFVEDPDPCPDPCPGPPESAITDLEEEPQ